MGRGDNESESFAVDARSAEEISKQAVIDSFSTNEYSYTLNTNTPLSKIRAYFALLPAEQRPQKMVDMIQTVLATDQLSDQRKQHLVQDVMWDVIGAEPDGLLPALSESDSAQLFIDALGDGNFDSQALAEEQVSQDALNRIYIKATVLAQGKLALGDLPFDAEAIRAFVLDNQKDSIIKEGEEIGDALRALSRGATDPSEAWSGMRQLGKRNGIAYIISQQPKQCYQQWYLATQAPDFIAGKKEDTTIFSLLEQTGIDANRVLDVIEYGARKYGDDPLFG